VPPSRVLKSRLAGVLVACNVTLSCVALFNAVSFGRLITVSVEALPNSSSATGTATKSQLIKLRFRQNDTDRNGYAGFGRPPADDDATVASRLIVRGTISAKGKIALIYHHAAEVRCAGYVPQDLPEGCDYPVVHQPRKRSWENVTGKILKIFLLCVLPLTGLWRSVWH
jgi:hypothetical protein